MRAAEKTPPDKHPSELAQRWPWKSCGGAAEARVHNMRANYEGSIGGKTMMLGSCIPGRCQNKRACVRSVGLACSDGAKAPDHRRRGRAHVARGVPQQRKQRRPDGCEAPCCCVAPLRALQECRQCAQRGRPTRLQAEELCHRDPGRQDRVDGPAMPRSPGTVPLARKCRTTTKPNVHYM